MDKLDAKIIVAFARSNMNISGTAQKMGYHRNTFTYMLDRIRNVTALDPRNFFDLGELYEIARGVLTDDEVEAI